MKIAIIYSTSSGITKKAAKILSNKIKAKIQLIPIEKAKTACLLKYDFIIIPWKSPRNLKKIHIQKYGNIDGKTGCSFYEL